MTKIHDDDGGDHTCLSLFELDCTLVDFSFEQRRLHQQHKTYQASNFEHAHSSRGVLTCPRVSASVCVRTFRAHGGRGLTPHLPAFYMSCCSGARRVGSWTTKTPFPSPVRTHLQGAHALVRILTLRSSWWGHHLISFMFISIRATSFLRSGVAGQDPYPNSFWNLTFIKFYGHAILNVWHTAYLWNQKCHSS